MKADVVYIGGGLASLIGGIKMLKEGKSVIIISAGQSTLHFSSGSFSLLNRFEGKTVLEPSLYIDNLPESHPYRKIGGAVKLSELLYDAQNILKECGIKLKGSCNKNHFRMTPFGLFTPTWLTLTDHLTFDSLEDPGFENAAIIGIDGFLDFYPVFIAKGLEKIKVDTVEASVNIKEFDKLRENPTEMRAPNIARSLTEDGVKRYAEAINRNSGGAQVVIIPGVVGLNDFDHLNLLRDLTESTLYTVTTIPVAVSGIRLKIMLQQYFIQFGGWYLLGDTVTNGVFKDDILMSVNTTNLGSTRVQSENFVIATGGLFSRGLKSDHEKIYEPVFGLDVEYSADRSGWYDKNFYNPQPFMKYGVKTDDSFRCFIEGKRIKNLYAAGSIIGGDFHSMYDGVGAGVTLSSAIHVANILTGKQG